MKPMTKEEREFNEDLGKGLLTLRDNAEMTQKEVADVLGSCANHVSELERGEARPTAWELYLYCEEFGGDPAALMGLKNRNSSLEEAIIRNVKTMTQDDKRIVLRIVNGLNPQKRNET